MANLHYRIMWLLQQLHCIVISPQGRNPVCWVSSFKIRQYIFDCVMTAVYIWLCHDCNYFLDYYCYVWKAKSANLHGNGAFFWAAYFCMDAFKHNVVPVVKMSAYIHGVLIFCGCLLSRVHLLIQWPSILNGSPLYQEKTCMWTKPDNINMTAETML